MTDNDIITIDIKKYAEALNNLIGVDSAYLKGDSDVDAIVEIITLAKKMENTINRQKSEIERLKKENAIVFSIPENTQFENLEHFETRQVSKEMLPAIVRRAKAEAITEFEERLKCEVKTDYINGTREHALSVITKIAKELKGEQ